MEQVSFLTCGDCAVIVAFPQEIREETNRRIRFLAARIQSAGIHGVQETVPTFCSLTVYYDPLVLPRKKLEHHILRLLGSYRDNASAQKRVFRIPVCYEGDFAPDMEEGELIQRLRAAASAAEAQGYHISVGIRSQHVGEICMDDLIRDAEKRMYADKAAYYARMGNGRAARERSGGA